MTTFTIRNTEPRKLTHRTLNSLCTIILILILLINYKNGHVADLVTSLLNTSLGVEYTYFQHIQN